MMLPTPPAPVGPMGPPTMPMGAPDPVGMPPMSAPEPEMAAPVDRGVLPSPLRDILGRQDKAAAPLMPASGPKTLSPQEQQQKFSAMTKSTQWAKDMAGMAQDPQAKYWLGLIGTYGWDGVRRYLDAMMAGK